MYWLLWAIYHFMWRTRRVGTGRIPDTGGVLLVANHQSYLDPLLVGTLGWRRLSYFARRTLFRNKVFGLLIWLGGAFAIDRDRVDTAGIKEAIRRLQAGEALLMFPEGTRSRDGSIGRVKPGFGMLARRAHVPILPVAIDGAYEAWPRGRRRPRRGHVRIAMGALIDSTVIGELSNEALAALVQEKLVELREEITRHRNQAGD